MATDNTDLNPGTGGDKISTDAITTLNGGGIATGEKAQRVKIGWGVDATFNDTNAAQPLPVVQTGTPPLSTGASTAAKQPALGTAGSASTDVITVQGIASGTVLPMSAASLPLPTGAATAAKQPALGTAGTASADVITVQGKTSMTPIVVDPSGVTSPVSGTVAVTGVATSTKQSDGSQKTQVVDGSGNVIGSTSNALDINIKSGNPTTIATTHADTAPATQNITAADIASTTTAQQNSQGAITGSPTASSAASFTIAGLATVDLQVTGTWSATLSIEVSFDSGTTWFTRGMHLAGTAYTVGTVTSNATGNLSVGGATNIRVRATAYTSGTAVVRVSGSINPTTFYIANSPSISDSTTPSQKLAIDSTGRIGTNQPPDKTGSGSMAGSNQTVVATTNGCSIVSFNITGTWSATLLIEGTIDGGSTWIAIDGDVDATDTIINNTTVNGFITVNCASYGQVRLRANPYTSGTANVTWSANQGLSLVEVYNTNGNSLRVQDLASGTAGATAPTNAQIQGNLAKTALPTAVTDGQLVSSMSDKFGRGIYIPQAPRDLITDVTVTITASTAETTILAAVASTFLDLTAVMVSNTSATAARVDFRDTTAGTIRFSLYVPAGDVRGMVLQVPRPQAAVNTNWTAQSSASVTDLRVYMQAVQNK